MNSEQEVIRTLVAAGESYYTEFKSAWQFTPDARRPRPVKDVARDIARTVVALANSDGGDLLVGVEDDGAFTGVPLSEDQIRYLVNVPQELVKGTEQVGVGSQVRTLDIEGVKVIWYRVQEYSAEPLVTVDGQCLWRRGPNTEPVPPSEIRRRREHRAGDTAYELVPVPTATLEDLDEDLIRQSLSTPRLRSRRSTTRLLRMPLETLLRYWNLVESRNGVLILRRAALLLFSQDPLRWHPNNRLRIRRVHGLEPSFGRMHRSREREVTGPIVRTLPRSIAILLAELSTERRVEHLFSTTQILPNEAIEECIVNAVAHRNYAIEGQSIEVLLYPDRVEVHSPGKIPEPLTVRDLREQKGVHRSRNPIIMRVLRDLGWSLDQGEGMRRIFGSMRQVELHIPELEERADTFVVRLSTTSIYDETTQSWLASYGPFGLRPEDRKFMVSLREAGGSMSVDRLARQLATSFDEAKSHLVRLERQGLVWHGYRSRTYHVVEASNVRHELAFRALRSARIDIKKESKIQASVLRAIAGTEDERSFRSFVNSWQNAGILQPAGKGSYRIGSSMLEYKDRRPSS